jgi:hypothetical protein
MSARIRVIVVALILSAIPPISLVHLYQRRADDGGERQQNGPSLLEFRSVRA